MKKLLSILLVISMMFSLIPASLLTVSATEVENENGVLTWSLTLKDDISVNFKMNIDESIAQDANAKVTAAVGGEVYSWSAAHAAANIINVPVCAAQMTDTITISVVDGSGSAVYSKDYTARDYADYILENSYSSDTKALVEAMLHYGAAAQTYFNYNTGNLANNGLTSSVTVPANDAKPVIVEDNLNGINFYGASLLMRNNITIRYYYTIAEGAEAVFTCNGEELTPVAKDGMYYVDVPVTSPASYCDDFVVTATSGDNSLSVTYSVERYVKRMYYKSTASSAMQALASSMYNYCKAAEVYVEKYDPILENYDYSNSAFDFSAAELNGEKVVKITAGATSGGSMPRYWRDLNAGDKVKITLTYESTLGADTNMYAWFYQMSAEGNNIGEYNTGRRGKVVDGVMMTGDGDNYVAESTFTLEYKIKRDCSGLVMLLNVPEGTAIYINSIEVEEADPILENYVYSNTAFDFNAAELGGEKVVKITNTAIDGSAMPQYWMDLKAGQTVNIKLTYESTLGADTNMYAWFYQMNADGCNIGEYNAGRRGKIVDGVMMTGDGDNYVAESTFTLSYQIQQDCSGLVMLLQAPAGTAIYIHSIEVVEDQSLLNNYDFNNSSFAAKVVNVNGEKVVKITKGATTGGTMPKYWRDLNAGDKVKINLTYESTLGEATDMYAWFYQMSAEGNNIGEYNTGRRGKVVDGVMMTGDGDNYVAESTFTLEYKIKRDCSGLVMLLNVPEGTAIYINSIEVEEADPILENYVYSNTAFDFNAAELNGEKVVKITNTAIDGSAMPQYWTDLKAGQIVNITLTYESTLGADTNMYAWFYQMNADGCNIGEYNAGRRGKVVDGVMMTGDGDNYVAESTFTLEYVIQQDCSGLVMLLQAPQGTAIYINSIEVVDQSLLNDYDFNNSSFAAKVVKVNGESVVKITKSATTGGTMPKYWRDLNAGDKVKINLTYESTLGEATDMYAWFYQMSAEGNNIGEYNTGRRGKVVDGVLMTGDGSNYVAESTFTLEYKIKQDCSGLVMLLNVPEGTAIYINSIEVEEADPILENYVYSNTAFDFNAAELGGEKVVKITNTAIDGGSMPQYWTDLKAGQIVNITLTYESSLGADTNMYAWFYQMSAEGNNIGEYNAGRRGKVVDGVLMTGDGDNYVAESTFTLSYQIQQDCSGLVMLLQAPQGTAIYINSITVYEAPIAVNYDLNGAVGTAPETAFLKKGSSYGTLPVPSVDSNMFIFDGWYLDTACSADKAVTKNSNVGTENHTLYAKWSILGFKADEVTYDLSAASVNGENAIKFTNVNSMPRYWRDLNAGDKVTIKLTYESTLGADTAMHTWFYQMSAEGNNIGEYNAGRRGKVVDGVMMTGDGDNYVAESTFTLEYKIKQDCSGLVMLMSAPEGTAIYIHSIEVEQADPILENYVYSNTAFDFNAAELNGEKVVKITNTAIDGSSMPQYWMDLKAGQTVNITLTYESSLGADTNMYAWFYQMSAEGNNIGEYNAGRRGKIVDGVMMTGDGDNYVAESTFTLSYKIQQDCSGLVMLLQAPAGTAIYINSIEVNNYAFDNSSFVGNVVNVNGEDVMKITQGATSGGTLPKYWHDLNAGDKVKINLTYESTLGADTNMYAWFYQMNADGNNINDYNAGRRGKVVDGVMMTGDGDNYVAESTFTLEYKIKQDCSGLVMLLQIPEGTAIYINSIEVEAADPILENYDYSNSAFDFNATQLNGEKVVKITNTAIDGSSMPRYWKNLKAGDQVEIKVTFESTLGADTNMYAWFYQMNEGGGNIGEYNTGRRGKVVDGVMMTGDGSNYVAESTFTLEYTIQQDCSGIVMLLQAPAGTAIYIHSIKVVDQSLLESYNFDNSSFTGKVVTFNNEEVVRITQGATSGGTMPKYWRDLNAGDKVKINLTYESTLGADTNMYAWFYQMNAEGNNIGEYNTGRRGKVVDGVMMTGDGDNYVAESTFTLEYKIKRDCYGLVMLLNVPEGTTIYINSIEVEEADPILENYVYSNTAFDFNAAELSGKKVIKITNTAIDGSSMPQYWTDLKAGQTLEIKVTFESSLGAEPHMYAWFYQMNADGCNIGEYNTGRRGKVVDGVMMTGDGDNYVAESTFTLSYQIQQDCSGIVMLLQAPAGTAIYIHSIEVAQDLFEIPEYEDNAEMSIGAWMGGTIAESTMKTNYWSLLKNANMNVALATPNTNVQQQLDEAYANGISVIVNERNWDGTVPSYVDHSAFMGMCVYDEPAYDYFSTLASQKAQWDASGLANDTYFVNVFPSYADSEILGEKWYDWGNTVTTYDRYIKDYIAAVNPEVLSMDHYPIVSTDGTKTIRDSWFSDMDICAHYASEAGIPFWYTLLSAGHLDYETATVEELRWQMAVGQAYGAQGLMHFLFGPQGDDYTAMLDQNLETTTELYDRVAIANAEVAKWDHIYMNFTWQGTDTILGSNNSSNSAFDLCKYAKDVTANSCITAISSNEDLLCGMFSDGTNQGFMLVNATNPAEGKDATMNITFEAGYTGALIIQKGVQKIIYLDSNSAQITVPSSEGIFIIPLA